MTFNRNRCKGNLYEISTELKINYRILLLNKNYLQVFITVPK